MSALATTAVDLAQAAWHPIGEVAIEVQLSPAVIYHAGTRGEITLRREGGRWCCQVWEARALAASRGRAP